MNTRTTPLSRERISQMTTAIAPPIAEPIIAPAVNATPAPRDCPLTARQCTVETCYNENDEAAQRACNLC